MADADEKKRRKAQPKIGKKAKSVIVRWPTVEMDLADMDAAFYNPRKISEHALAGLRNSLKEFGIVQDIVWNKRTNRIVGGHQRHAALLKEGEVTAEVKVVDLDEATEKKLNVTLNNPSIQGTWDEDKLSALLREFEANPGDYAPGSLKDLHIDELMASFDFDDLDLNTDWGEADEDTKQKDQEHAEDEVPLDQPLNGQIKVVVEVGREDEVLSAIRGLPGVVLATPMT